MCLYSVCLDMYLSVCFCPTETRTVTHTVSHCMYVNVSKPDVPLVSATPLDISHHVLCDS